MKILGINFGKLQGQNRHTLDKILAACEEAGSEIKRIDALKLYIAPSHPEETKNAVQDDFQVLLDEVLDCDGLIVGCPVYALQPTGQFKSFVDRIAEKYQVRSGEVAKEAPGPKYISYISIGGAREHHWVSLSMPLLKSLGRVLGCAEIDEMDVNGHPPYPADMKKMAETMVRAIREQDISYQGNTEGVCPACHGTFITVLSGTDVICPICGKKGKMVFEGDTVRIAFD